ncbi:MAG TPA: hypothetical protein PKC65_08195 [Pyrinomonadaceae bacterium]|nr:hypothetical protein [Pyrinomonadaceae bacterium]
MKSKAFADFGGFRIAYFAFPTRNLNAKNEKATQRTRRFGCGDRGGNTTGRECVLVGGKPPPASRKNGRSVQEVANRRPI